MTPVGPPPTRRRLASSCSRDPKSRVGRRSRRRRPRGKPTPFAAGLPVCGPRRNSGSSSAASRRPRPQWRDCSVGQRPTDGRAPRRPSGLQFSKTSTRLRRRPRGSRPRRSRPRRSSAGDKPLPRARRRDPIRHREGRGRLRSKRRWPRPPKARPRGRAHRHPSFTCAAGVVCFRRIAETGWPVLRHTGGGQMRTATPPVGGRWSSQT